MKKAYTLIELIIVMAIILVLLLPSINIANSINNAINRAEAIVFCNELSNMISYGKFYCMKNRSYGEIEINKSVGKVSFKDKKQGGKIIKSIYLNSKYKFSTVCILKINNLGHIDSDTIQILDSDGNVYKVAISTGVDTVNIYEGN